MTCWFLRFLIQIHLNLRHLVYPRGESPHQQLDLSFRGQSGRVTGAGRAQGPLSLAVHRKLTVQRRFCRCNLNNGGEAEPLQWRSGHTSQGPLPSQRKTWESCGKPLPNNAWPPPLSPADVFFSVSLALMVVSLLETVLITNIQLSSSHGAIPDWLRTLMLQYVAVVVCLPPSKKKRTVTVFLNPSASATGGKFLGFSKTLKGFDAYFSTLKRQ